MPLKPFASEPSLSEKPFSKAMRQAGQLAKIFLLVAGLDVILGLLTFYIAAQNSHGKGGPDANSIAAAQAFVLVCVVLRLVLVVVLVRTKGYAQGAAAIPGLVLLVLLTGVLLSA